MTPRKIMLLISLALTVSACASEPEEKNVTPIDKAEIQKTKINDTEFATDYSDGRLLDENELGLKTLMMTALSPVEGISGAAVLEVGTNRVIIMGHQGPLPQQSVSKLWVALAVADKISKGQGSYTDSITISQADRALFHQPLARYVENGPISVNIAQLMNMSLTQSDNMANSILTDYAGGAGSVRDWLQKFSPSIRFGPGDRQMQAGISGLTWNPVYADRLSFEQARGMVSPAIRAERYAQYVKNPIDGADVESLVKALASLRLGHFPGSREVLSFMSRTNTGSARLKAGTPSNWMLLHKTGTGQTWNGRTAGFNDIGIMESPSGTSYAVAVMIGDSSSPDQIKQKAIADIARAVVAYDQKKLSMRSQVASVDAENLSE